MTVDQLRPRHAQIVALIGQGKSNAEIAAITGLCVGTVKVAISRIYRLMGYSVRGACSGNPRVMLALAANAIARAN